MTGRTIRRLVAATGVAALVLTACGGGGNGNEKVATATTEKASAGGNGSTSSTAQSGNVKSDGCEILTAADATAVFGVPVTNVAPGTEPQQMLASCVWDGGAGTGNMALVSKLLQLQVYDGAIFFAPDQLKDMAGFETIAGIGDGAYAFGTGSFDLTILAGKRTVAIGASGFTPDDRARVRQTVLDLAPKVLDRM